MMPNAEDLFRNSKSLADMTEDEKRAFADKMKQLAGFGVSRFSALGGVDWLAQIRQDQMGSVLIVCC
jgi:hypothetical protein